jgi:ABC-type lipoprotein release transport system permease subunit
MPTRSDTLQGALPLLVLTVLARRGPLHGYAITTHIHRLSDALRIEEGSLYPALHRMEEAGWIRAGAGVCVGLGAALGVARLVTSLLFDLQPADVITLAIVIPSIVALAAVASWVPAWRASRLDPNLVLRAD